MTLFVRQFLAYFTSAVGVSWLFIEIGAFFLGQHGAWLKSSVVFWIVIMCSIVYGIVLVFPKKRIRLRVAGTDAYVSVHYDDILSHNGHIAIPSSNFFNTDMNIISANSVLGQIIVKWLKSDTRSLEASLKQSLRTVSPTHVNVARGKLLSYPMGTVGVFEMPGGKKGFLVAMTQVNYAEKQETVQTELSFVQAGIRSLWTTVRAEINDEPLNMVPLGSGISHVFHRTLDSVIFLASEYVRECKSRRPCSELRIFIRRKDMSFADAAHLKEALSAIVN